MSAVAKQEFDLFSKAMHLLEESLKTVGKSEYAIEVVARRLCLSVSHCWRACRDTMAWFYRRTEISKPEDVPYIAYCKSSMVFKCEHAWRNLIKNYRIMNFEYNYDYDETLKAAERSIKYFPLLKASHEILYTVLHPSPEAPSYWVRPSERRGCICGQADLWAVNVDSKARIICFECSAMFKDEAALAKGALVRGEETEMRDVRLVRML